MHNLKNQLEIFGVQEVIQRAELEPIPNTQKRRAICRIETMHEMLTELPGTEDLFFLHSGFCQTCLSHSKPADDSHVWRRTAGHFSLIVSPAFIEDHKPGHMRQRDPEFVTWEFLTGPVPAASQAERMKRTAWPCIALSFGP